MKLAVSSFPDRLSSTALGPVLTDWTNKFKPALLDTSSDALSLAQRSIRTIADQLETLEAQMSCEPIPTDEQKAEQVRLANLLSVQVSTLERLTRIHDTLTRVGTAALVHSFTRSTLPADNEERNVTPARKIGSGIGQVIDV